MAYNPQNAKRGAALAGLSVAKCVLDFLYSMALTALQILKAIILAMIAAADLYIQQLKAQILLLDLISTAEEIAWQVYEAILNALKEQLLFPEELGPYRDICPEFYALVTDPALALLDLATSGISVFRERYKQGISFKDEVEALYQVWVAYKNELVALVESIDDAIYWSKMEIANAADAALDNSFPPT
jgi:hypothetical protein